MYELEDAQEHLTALISEMNATDDFDELICEYNWPMSSLI